MRIAFLNPWSESAENQAFENLRAVAERAGHDLVQCVNSAEVDQCAPDFVLAASLTQPKLNDFPHYGIIHAPLDRYFTNRGYFHNLLSYDGYLAIADNLCKYLRNVMFGVGRVRPVGFYFNTSQRCDASADLRSLIDRRALRITHFGTNWDKRRLSFFRKLSQIDGVEILGPESAWPDIRKSAYGGPLPFDGSSVQKKYAANGIGLCLLSEDHLRDDIISNRIFEITAAGAIAFCCDIPWIRKHFGDSVYYFQQNLGDDELLAAILKLRESIYIDPPRAIDKAARARKIFETNFTSELLFGNLIRYHREITSLRDDAIRIAEESHSPLISVIVRCGSRSSDYIERAIASIGRQTYGRFDVILVRHQPADLDSLDASMFPRIVSLRIVDCIGGNRSASLWAGLNAVNGEYFSILDDDDWLFSNHFELLFHPLPLQSLRNFLAYSGSLTVHPQPVPIPGGGSDDRELLRFGIESLEDWKAAAAAFASNCFVASSDLLTPRLRVCPDMETAEDSYLILSLMAHARPRFSFAATSVFDRSLADQSGFAEHPQRFEDELTLQLRLLGPDRPPFLATDAWKSLFDYWERRPFLSHHPHIVADSQSLLGGWEEVSAGYQPEKSDHSTESSFTDSRVGSATIQAPLDPWSYGAQLSIPPPSREASDYTLVVKIWIREGTMGFGLLNLQENDFLFRQPLRANPEPETLLIPIRDISNTGRLVIQNWETRGKSRAELVSIRLMAPPGALPGAPDGAGSL